MLVRRRSTTPAATPNTAGKRLPPAGDDLNIAQQAVSQQIQALERALGVTLLRRTSRHVELTAEGATLLDGARRVLAAADNASSAVKAVARG